MNAPAASPSHTKDDTDRSAGPARVWSSGDYPRLAERFAPAAEVVATHAGPGIGRTAVDVAAGTGTVSVALARRSWRVEAVDVSPVLLEHGRRHTEREGLEVSWHEADMARLPQPDEQVDLVASSFGLIFATDPVAALLQTRRVLRPGGRLVLTAWTSSSYLAQMTARMARFLPSQAGAEQPFRWGDRATVLGWLAGAGLDVVTTRRASIPWEFGSAQDSADFLFECSPGHVAALAATDDPAAMRRTVVEHAREATDPQGRLRLQIEYLVVVARRA